jgi:predicted AlkP superfamily pyrophosphatase or phosphodiesterase
MKVICILSDALRYDYIEKHDMKFLKEMVNENNCFYVKRILPSTGFCEIIEYVTGKEAENHGMLTQITSKKDWYNVRPNKLLNILTQSNEIIPLNRIPRINRVYSNIVDNILGKYISADMVNVRYNIPFNLLPFLEPTESKYEYDNHDFGGDDNIFIWMKKNGISYDIDDFVKHNKIEGSDKDRLNRLKNKILQNTLKDFTLLYIGYGEYAHFLGTDSERFGTLLRDYSKQLMEIYNLLNDNYDEFQLMILGDHGMIDVNNGINIKHIVHDVMKKMNLKYLDDYIYFIDSTLFRMWVKNENLIDDIEHELINKLGGCIEEDAETFNYFNKFKPDYGNIILLLKPGYMFFPDFFNTKINKGMHGYLNKYPEQSGTLIGFGRNVKGGYKESMNLSEVKRYIQTLW